MFAVMKINFHEGLEEVLSLTCFYKKTELLFFTLALVGLRALTAKGIFRTHVGAFMLYVSDNLRSQAIRAATL